MASQTSVKSLRTPCPRSSLRLPVVPQVAAPGDNTVCRPSARSTVKLIAPRSRDHSQAGKAPSFQCRVCGKYVSTEQGLKSHMTRLGHWEDVNPPSSERTPFQNLDGNSTQFDTVNPGFHPEEFLQLLSTFRRKTRVIRRLPKAARAVAASVLSEVIEACLHEKSISAWERLFLFPYVCFQLPEERCGVSLATLITRNIASFREGKKFPDLTTSTRHKSPPSPVAGEDREKVPAKLIESKISEGDVRGAIRILCSDMCLAPFDEVTLARLVALHPEADVQEREELEDFEVQGPPVEPMTISADEVKAAIASFPAGSAGGLDRMLPQHLKDLTSHSAGPAGVRLLTSLASLSTLMVRGQVPEHICPILYGASLCALSKKGGGVRPIAVGSVFRRLTAKICSKLVMGKLGHHLQPTQFGFGIKGGAEAVAHATRRYINFPHKAQKVVLKLDFANAFNSIDRNTVLREVSNLIPETLPFLRQCYGQASLLSFGAATVPSSRGIQQGDPLGPALFCLAVHPLASQLRSELNVWYLDDVTIGGSLEEVLKDLATITQRSREMGLTLNVSKCEVLSLGVSPLSSDAIREQMPLADSNMSNMSFPPPEDWVLLGAPLTELAISKCLASKIGDLERMIDKLGSVSSHCAFFVFKNALSIPKLLYVLRCAPTWKSWDFLQTYDLTLTEAVQKITNINFSEAITAQAFLPVAEGGLGLRKATSLATSAFLASVESVGDLILKILPSYVLEVRDVSVEEGTQLWLSSTGLPLPPQESRGNQAIWEKGFISLAGALVQESATSLSDKARLLSVKSSEAGAFLQAVPSPQLGTYMEDEVFRVALSIRLGANICEPHVCACGVPIDRRGLHGLSCHRSAGRSARHVAANDIIKRALGSAGFPSLLEPQGLSMEAGLRPDGVTLTPWSQGRSLAWDFTCVDAQAASYIESSAGIPLFAATRAESLKTIKYRSIAQNHIFAPIAVECLGSFGGDSLKTLKTIGRKMAVASGEKRSSEYLFQRLSVAIQRGNATAILNCLPRDISLDAEIYTL